MCFYLIITDSPKYTKDAKSKETRIMPVLNATKFDFSRHTNHISFWLFFSGHSFSIVATFTLGVKLRDIQGNSFLKRFDQRQVFRNFKILATFKTLVIDFINFVYMESILDNSILADIQFFSLSVSEVLNERYQRKQLKIPDRKKKKKKQLKIAINSFGKIKGTPTETS